MQPTQALRAQPDHTETLIWSAAIKSRLAIETSGPRAKSRFG